MLIACGLVLSVGADWRFESIHGRQPILGCVGRHYKFGPTADPAQLEGLSMATIKLGMEASEARSITQANSIRSHVEVPYHEDGMPADFTSAGYDLGRAHLPAPDLVSLATTISPTTDRKVVNYRAMSTTTQKPHRISSLSATSSIKNVEETIDKIKRKFGKPSWQYETWGDCGNTTMLVYGQDGALANPGFPGSYFCGKSFNPPFFVLCRRSAMPKSTWLLFQVSRGYLTVALTDGKALIENLNYKSVNTSHNPVQQSRKSGVVTR